MFGNRRLVFGWFSWFVWLTDWKPLAIYIGFLSWLFAKVFGKINCGCWDLLESLWANKPKVNPKSCSRRLFHFGLKVTKKSITKLFFWPFDQIEKQKLMKKSFTKHDLKQIFTNRSSFIWYGLVGEALLLATSSSNF